MKAPDWKFWTLKDEVKYWQAASLSMGIDPYAIHKHPEYWASSRDLLIGRRGFRSDAEFREFMERRQLAEVFTKQIADRERSMNLRLHGNTSLSGFISWCIENGVTVPPELAATDNPRGATAVVDPDAELAALFDPVGTEQLDTMFPSGGKWKAWADKAASNGLIDARRERRMFNPYLAARWWLREQDPRGWDWAHCIRKLANNLPARSVDAKSLLTGELD